MLNKIWKISVHEKMRYQLKGFKKWGVYIMCSKILNKINSRVPRKNRNKEHDIEYQNVFGDLWEIIEHIKNLK